MSNQRSHTPPSSSLEDLDQPSAKRVKLSVIPNEPIASTSKLPYERGLHLAPMVRIGTLPTRLLALEYGAELVWGPEIVAQAIIGTTRIVDPISGTINYVKNNRSIFECHPIEKSRLIFQLGTSDPSLAVEAALVVAGDVGGIGLNCGCPKSFSLSGGMGAALLKVPDKLCAILKALVTSVSVPIDAKIRLLPDEKDTYSLVTQILETGISALTVHCRTQEMRSSEPALLSRLKPITEMGKLKGIPVIENGDCYGVEDKKKIEEITGTTSMMIARGAESNPSCFRSEGLLDIPSIVAPAYFKLAYLTGNHYSNTKYVLKSLSPIQATNPLLSKAERSNFKNSTNSAKDYEAMASVLGVDLNELKGGKVKIEDLMPLWCERLKLEKEEVVEVEVEVVNEKIIVPKVLVVETKPMEVEKVKEVEEKIEVVAV